MHVEQRPVGRPVLARQHLLDDDRDRVRQLVADALQRSLPDQLGDEHQLRLVGELAVRVERRRLRHQVGEQPGQQLDLLAGDGRDGHDLGPVDASDRPISATAVSASATRSRLTRSVLVTTATFGDPAERRQLARDEPVARADLLVGRQAEAHDVDLRPGRADLVVEPLPQQRARPVQTRGVEHDQLGVRPVHDAAHDPPGGLRLARGDDDLLAHQRVGQRGLAGVRSPDEGDEPGAVRSWLPAPVSSVGVVTTSRPGRRPRRPPRLDPLPAIAGQVGRRPC